MKENDIIIQHIEDSAKANYRQALDTLNQLESRGLVLPDAFGLSAVETDYQTAIVIAEEIGITPTLLFASMFQNAVRMGLVSIENIEEQYGKETASLLNNLLGTDELFMRSASVETDNFRSLLISQAGDMRVILILIAQSVALMRQIRDTANIEAQHEASRQAAFLYAPLAHKLGLYKLKSELEDLSLKYLEHDAYYHIKDKLNETKRNRDLYIERFVKPIDERLTAAGLHFHMKGRTKSIHSIWQKMKKQHVDVDGVYDLFAIRIIIDAPKNEEHAQCWQAFSIITDMYPSNPKRMRDWLSVPKANGYESLHITVLGPEDKWVEVQIRTERMDDIAEHGLAAHWRYKGVTGSQSGTEELLADIRSALEQGESINDSASRVSNEVFVFTPRGDLFRLPAGATVLDFAYAIHTKVGNRCTGARIGNRHADLRHKLQSGDQVEILTSNNQSPKQDWLGIVTTNRAKSKIRQSLKEAQAGHVALAKELLERKMRNRKLDYSEATLMHTIKRLGYKNVTDFYHAIAEEKLDVNQVLEVYQGQQRHERGEESSETRSAADFVMQENANGPSATKDDVLVIDQNLKGIEFQLAKCCHPIYGDDVFGFVSSTGGIKIHRTDCPNAQAMRQRAPYRFVRARWASKQGTQYSITLHIVGQDDMGIVNNITSVISKEERMLMRSINIDSHDGLFSGHLTVMLEDTERLAGLIRKLKNIRGVKNVTRV
ncbi:MAG: bifunctional (p)ppGpp synthetase/guanosine-3',5'-bis(diphosphate) 3'-pyrophosphohydrolase [Bacteroidaceae bacterium]|nr:bifunctional (p)ppGpp synthetase/guanosine-3',5'-bis(diphosphate) 3'-pyrophosphohydrolase [Bacteroidaceae bacterium]